MSSTSSIAIAFSALQKSLSNSKSNPLLPLSCLSSDGLTLTLNGTSYDATMEYEIIDEDPNNKYSLASLFLQAHDRGEMGLLKYRKLCESYGVPVCKASHKQDILAQLIRSQIDDQDDDNGQQTQKQQEEEQEQRRDDDDMEESEEEEEEYNAENDFEQKEKVHDKDDHEMSRDHHGHRSRHSKRSSSRREEERKHEKDHYLDDRDHHSKRHRDSKRDRESSERTSRDRDRDRGRHGSSRKSVEGKDRKRRSDKDRDRKSSRSSISSSSKKRNREGREISSSTRDRDNHHHSLSKKDKKEKTPMTHEQLFQNLEMVVDKRTATHKSNNTIMDTNHIQTSSIHQDKLNDKPFDSHHSQIVPPTNKDKDMDSKDNDTATTETNVTATATATANESVPIDTSQQLQQNIINSQANTTVLQITKPQLTVEEQRNAILQCLSSKGFEVHKLPRTQIDKDMAMVEQIMSLEIPVGNSASILRCGGQGASHNSSSTNNYTSYNTHNTPNSKSPSTSGYSNGSSSGSSIAKTRDFSRILQLYNDTIRAEEKAKRDGSSSSHKRTDASSSTAHMMDSKRTAAGGGGNGRNSISTSIRLKPDGRPIIIVPNAMTSPLTLLNSHEFFQKSVFIPRDIMLRKMAGSRKPSSVLISRKVSSRLGGGILNYEIIDNPVGRLKEPKEWNRVVAVVAQGASWQFKGWKIGVGGSNSSRHRNSNSSNSNNTSGSTPVEIFSKSYGFFISVEGAPVPRDIMGWNVKRGVLSRDKRGLDSVVFASFWNGLDEWMSIHRPEYLPSEHS
eukprot:CAMPEP_0184870516 /NCGR_PEP_ID=MMETSP0580-20130426/37744_1 /TAXON_ID=1118495 /ORGANISM="Dactyliosolen fragilissimus" /LENGTH=787 /DNA_ID=CAMNT_0027372623 /DNA_START=9 /DNA_END=2372 /DNA_ORIENTATION=-